MHFRDSNRASHLFQLCSPSFYFLTLNTKLQSRDSKAFLHHSLCRCSSDKKIRKRSKGAKEKENTIKSMLIGLPSHEAHHHSNWNQILKAAKTKEMQALTTKQNKCDLMALLYSFKKIMKQN